MSVSGGRKKRTFNVRSWKQLEAHSPQMAASARVRDCARLASPAGDMKRAILIMLAAIIVAADVTLHSRVR